MLRRIGHELWHHVPFTAAGAVSGLAGMVVITLLHVPRDASEALFYVFHPLHVLFSSLVTTAMYRRHGGKPWLAVLIGYVGSVGIATLSDAIIPYLEGSSLRIVMEFHLPFLSPELVPFFGVREWIIVNSAAAIGIAVGCFKPKTRMPHMVHVLLSTWASLFGFTAFGTADWIPLLGIIFIFLFLAVWIPCCFSDIVFPLLWTAREPPHAHGYAG